MATTDKPAAKKEAEPITAERFANVITDMSRFLNRLTTYQPLADAGISLSEWTALVAIAGNEDGKKQLTRELGLTRQRVNQITDALKGAGYVEVTKSTDDARRTEVKLSASGRQHLDAVNSQLTTALAAELSGRERALESVGKSLRALTRSMARSNAKGEGKAGGKANAEGKARRKSRPEADSED